MKTIKKKESSSKKEAKKPIKEESATELMKFVKPIIYESFKGDTRQMAFHMQMEAKVFPELAEYAARLLIRGEFARGRNEQEEHALQITGIKEGLEILGTLRNGKEDEIAQAAIDGLIGAVFYNISESERIKHQGTWHVYNDALTTYLNKIIPVREVLKEMKKDDHLLDDAIFTKYTPGHTYLYNGSFFGGVERHAKKVKDSIFENLSEIVRREDSSEERTWDWSQGGATECVTAYYGLLRDSKKVLADLKQVDPVRYAKAEYAENEE